MPLFLLEQPTRPPNDFPSVNPPTNPPNGVLVGLTPYGLLYTMPEPRLPFRSEVIELVEVTRLYLAGIFESEYQNSDNAVLDDFLTVYTGNNFERDEPIPIYYESEAIFDFISTDIPTVEELDDVLAGAFVGENLNGYIGLLQALPTSNIFSETTFVEKIESGVGGEGEPAVIVSDRQRSSIGGASIAGIAAAGATVSILLAGFLLLRNPSSADDSNDEAATLTKKGGKKRRRGDSMTVAGETVGLSIGGEDEGLQDSATESMMEDIDETEEEISFAGEDPERKDAVDVDWSFPLKSISLMSR